MNDNKYALQMQDITVEFPGVLANDHVSIDCKKGEVLGLLGENGAGKTTLMNVLYGLYPPSSGWQGGTDRFSLRSDFLRCRYGPPAFQISGYPFCH